ncbi:MAG: guanine deaminase [Bacteroides sp. SM23_62]|jgi:guanine deaminase|nr:MAG: guanine deaminase [Bacteroides sp. SM23_62]
MGNRTIEDFMRMAIRMSIDNVERGGGPFAALIVRDGEIVSTGINSVAEENDPTAHAEINAIRSATKELQRFKLNDCVLYSTCEPCPMCLGAVYWSGIPTIYFGNSREDAAKYGFDDSYIYQQIGMALDERQVRFTRILGKEAIEAFNYWDQQSDKIQY